MPWLGASLGLVPQLLVQRENEAVPAAYLRAEFYSADSQLVAQHERPLVSTAEDTWQPLRLHERIDSTGYVRVSVCSASSQDVYFDDLHIQPVRSKVDAT